MKSHWSFLQSLDFSLPNHYPCLGTRQFCFKIQGDLPTPFFYQLVSVIDAASLESLLPSIVLQETFYSSIAPFLFPESKAWQRKSKLRQKLCPGKKTQTNHASALKLPWFRWNLKSWCMSKPEFSVQERSHTKYNFSPRTTLSHSNSFLTHLFRAVG